MAGKRMYHLGKDSSKANKYRITLGRYGTLVSKHKKSKTARRRIRQLAKRNNRDYKIHI